MKTIVTFKDGHVETVEDAAPVFEVEVERGLLFSCINAQSECVTDEIPLDLIERVVFEP